MRFSNKRIASCTFARSGRIGRQHVDSLQKIVYSSLIRFVRHPRCIGNSVCPGNSRQEVVILKVHRLLSIVMHLLTRKRIGAQELADLFEVSLRTIYRDLETINSAGIPIVSYSGPNGGYEIMEQYHIDRQIVTLEDLRSIKTALNGLEASLRDPQLSDVIVKVGALITKAEQAKLEESGDELLFNANLWRGRQADNETIAKLRQAARFRYVVRIRYITAQGAEEVREVEPIGLAWKGYAWYLHAYCRLRQDYRTFRLTRIKHCQVLEERFAARGVGLKELDARWDASGAASPQIRMVLRFHPRQRVRVEEYFPPEEIEVDDEGYYRVDTVHAEDEWLYGTLLSFGPDVTVLEPDHLAQNVKQRALQIAGRYK